jgi:hypothetical protein
VSAFFLPIQRRRENEIPHPTMQKHCGIARTAPGHVDIEKEVCSARRHPQATSRDNKIFFLSRAVHPSLFKEREKLRQ